MSVVLNFTCLGVTLTEATPLNFGTVQAGMTSPIRKVVVTNTGTSDAQNCRVDALAASVTNGFSTDLQQGQPSETYSAQKFAAADTATTWYSAAFLGVGKNYASSLGGTLANTTGTDSFATQWLPPANGSAGDKVWGNKSSCQYVY